MQPSDLSSFKCSAYPIQLSDLCHTNHPTYFIQPSNLSLFKCSTYSIQLSDLPRSNPLLIPLQPPNLSHTITQLTRFNCSTYPNTTVRLIPLLIPYNHRWLCQKCDIVDTTFHASCVPGPCTATQSALPTLRGKAGRQH